MEDSGRTGACPWWEGVGGFALPPPRNWKKEAVRGNFNLFHLYFTTFFSDISFFQLFSELAPLPLKKQKKKRTFSPPLLMNSWTRACMVEFASPTW